MFSSTVTAFLVIYTLEAFIIIVGNTFTIFVFWTQRSQLKRTYSILINLAVSDLLVGIAEPIVLGTAKIAKMTAIPGKENSFTNPSSGTCLFRFMASSSPCDQNSVLHFRRNRCLGSWILLLWAVCIILISYKDR